MRLALLCIISPSAIPFEVFIKTQMNDYVYWQMQTEKVRNENSNDISVLQAISVVLNRHPELRYGEKCFSYNLTYVCFF